MPNPGLLFRTKCEARIMNLLSVHILKQTGLPFEERLVNPKNFREEVIVPMNKKQSNQQVNVEFFIGSRQSLL